MIYTRYHAENETEHSLSAYTVNNPLTKACGLSRYRQINHALTHNSTICTRSHNKGA